MDINRDELSRIKDVLRSNPRGMNVIEIARAINMHRQSVAKYLEMLVIAGHVDVKAFGPSKVYYISRRLPLSAMLNLSSNFILVADKDLRIININDRFLDLSKTKRDDILNKDLEHFSFLPGIEPPIMPRVTEALKGKESCIEAHYKKRGNEQFFNIKFIPLVFDDGQPGVTIMFEDITGRELMDKAIRESEEQFRVLAETISAGVALYQGENFINANRAFEHITGYSNKELLTMKFWDIAHRDDKVMVKERGLTRQRGQAVTPQYECKLITKSGEIRYVEFNAGYIVYKGKPGGVITCFDITERKKAEEKLKENEDSLAKAQQISHFGSWKLYMETGRMSVSNELYRILGFESAQAAMGSEININKLLEYIHIEDRARFTDNMETALHDKGGHSLDVRIIRRDGNERILHIEQEVTFSDAGHPMFLYGICQDITERKRIEEDREELIRQLRESNEQLSMIMHVTESSATTLSLDETLNSILNRLIRDMSADVCAILLKDNGRVYIQSGQAEKLAQARASIPVGNGFESTIISSGKPIFLDEAQLNSGTFNPVLKEICARSLFGVPVRHRNDIIGVLYVEWMLPHAFKKQEQDVLQIIADRCGASIMMQSFMKRPKNFIDKTYINRNKYF